MSPRHKQEDGKHHAKRSAAQNVSPDSPRPEGGADDLNEALEDSFPASDPPSMTQPKTKPGSPTRKAADASIPSKR